MQILALVTQKGGSGKSTIASSLAIAAHEAGERVFVIDMDPQASLVKWFKVRGGKDVAVESVTPGKLAPALKALDKAGVSLVIIDTPGTDSPAAEAAMKVADLCIIPARPNVFDLWASEATRKALRALKREYVFLLNQCPPAQQSARVEEGAKALAMLANHLQRIKILIPAGPLVKMQTLEIWIEHSHPTLKSKQYHPSRDWLVANRHDPRLTRKVHIPQARDLLSREQLLKHPAVVLHELAHAYHDQILSFDHPEIIAAYEKAKAAGNYENVLAHTGKRVKHYGLNNHKEYFAEGTEAFFYRNDFYPFVRAELKEHDPALQDLLIKIWEPAQ